MPEIVVAGGGLAGLVAARHLANAGVDVTLYERREAVGGRVGTRQLDGFVLDRGFQVLFTAYPAARRELEYGDLALRRFRPGAIVAEDGRRSVLGDPLRNPTALPATLFSGAVRPGDLWRLFRLRRRLTGQRPDELLDGSDATIREGLEAAGFSERFRSAFAEPFYGGITLDRSLSTALGVFEYTFKMLAEGAAAVPADGGMSAIPEQLADRARGAGARIETGTAVEGLDAGAGEVTVDLGGESETALGAVVATDPRTARGLTGVEAIPTEARGCVTQFYSLAAHSALDMNRRILLNGEGDGTDGPNHVVPHAEVAPGHAPVGQTLLSATYLGAEDREDAALAERTRDALSRWYPERTFGDLEPVHTERVPFAQVTQPPGFRDDIPDVDSPEGPVVLAGDYTRWSSIQGALESGREAALAAIDAVQ